MEGLYDHENKVRAPGRSPPVGKVGCQVCEDCQKGEQIGKSTDFFGIAPLFP